MKQFLRLVIAVIALFFFTLPSQAQNRPSVTLDHEGTLTVFDGPKCLEYAITASVDGDVLYLSEGSFAATEEEINLGKKLIYFRGCGYNTYIIPKIFWNSNNELTYNDILLDGLRLEEVEFKYINSFTEYNNTRIQNCYLNKLTCNRTGSLFIDRCNIGVYDGSSYGETSICNSKIEQLYPYNSERLENCNIGNVIRSSNNTSYRIILQASSCIISKVPDIGVGNSFLENCVIPESVEKSNRVVNCYHVADAESILDPETLEATVDLAEKGYLGVDGTVVGIYGGPDEPFSENPSIPTVDTKNSTVEYDSATGQLKVKIAVLPD